MREGASEVWSDAGQSSQEVSRSQTPDHQRPDLQSGEITSETSYNYKY